MALSSPVRAALPLWGLALGVLVAVASLYVGSRWNAPVQEQAAHLNQATHLLLAAVESGAPSLEQIARGHFERGGDSARAHVPSLFVIDRDGQPQLIYRPATGEVRAVAEVAIDWRMHVASAGPRPVQHVVLNEQPFLVAIREASNGRAFLALAAPIVPAGRGALLARAAGVVVIAWLLLAAGVWVVLRGAARRPLEEAASFGTSLAAHLTAEERDTGAIKTLIGEAGQRAGPLAKPLVQVARRVGELHTNLTEARAQLNALFQIHGSYIVLATLEGTIIDANPAFYAAAELPSDVLRGAPDDILDDIMPMGPILEMARRSQSEGAAFADIEYAIKGKKTRPVKLALLAVPAEGRPAVLVVATDKTKERTLERQIESFSDSLDLMVDKRVEELTNGQERVDALVAAAGAVLVAFDRAGSTRRWNDVAQRVTGCSLSHVPRMDDLPRAFGLSAADRAAFSAWLHANVPEPCVVTVHADAPNAELYAWHRAVLDAGELNERRVLVGLALPPFDAADGLMSPPVAAAAPADEPHSDAQEPRASSLSERASEVRAKGLWVSWDDVVSPGEAGPPPTDRARGEGDASADLSFDSYADDLDDRDESGAEGARAARTDPSTMPPV